MPCRVIATESQLNLCVVEHAQLCQTLECIPAGVNIYAACFLIPIGVVIYTSVGGLKVSCLVCYLRIDNAVNNSTLPRPEFVSSGHHATYEQTINSGLMYLHHIICVSNLYTEPQGACKLQTYTMTCVCAAYCVIRLHKCMY